RGLILLGDDLAVGVERLRGKLRPIVSVEARHFGPRDGVDPLERVLKFAGAKCALVSAHPFGPEGRAKLAHRSEIGDEKWTCQRKRKHGRAGIENFAVWQD